MNSDTRFCASRWQLAKYLRKRKLFQTEVVVTET
jgi:hypothetical protein